MTDLDTLARTLALSDGIGPLTWSAMDECERMYYRREAAKMNPLQYQSATPLCPYCFSGMKPAMVRGGQVFTCICPEGVAATQKAILSKQPDDPNHSIPGDGPPASEPRK